MNVIKNFIISGVAGKPISTDIHLHADTKPKPVIIYVHGFNGFKDWANFSLIADQFVQAGYVLIKFNFSHNGTTPGQPEDFVDLASYAENNYTTQLNEIGILIDWCVDIQNPFSNEINTNQVFLLGHSLGGGLIILKAAEDLRVKKVATWAAISECKTPWGNWSKDRINEWKATGVSYTINSRTMQQMPLNFQLYEDYQLHKNRLNIERAIRSLSIPVLLCHGTLDGSVTLDKARALKSWQPKAELFLVDSDHVFGRKHPWFALQLPEAMQIVVDRTIQFLSK